MSKEEKKESAAQNKENTGSEMQTENQETPKTELQLAQEKIASLEKQVEDLKKSNADLNDQVLRRAADFDNYRKRSIQEKQEVFDFANTNLLKDLLDSLDNFDRTIDAAATATDPKTIADGIRIINKSMVSMLENKYNLAAYGEVGDAFNPDLHEAIGSSQDPVAEPVLKAVYLKGYKLKDRVIRHAKVMVSMPDGTVTENKENNSGEAEAEDGTAKTSLDESK
ncbi:nucleotide exchange factor GrpE [uncultured Treponema sp.]|uniref:nucleotide exchange factor GrpE n=1 Tax=Treponema peruense TaxID=2787628 RepID=UPI002597FBB3|nr:nucleotide exchange factor GrpE [uncultured Treponema sp.]